MVAPHETSLRDEKHDEYSLADGRERNSGNWETFGASAYQDTASFRGATSQEGHECLSASITRHATANRRMASS